MWYCFSFVLVYLYVMECCKDNLDFYLQLWSVKPSYAVLMIMMMMYVTKLVI